MEKNSAWFKSFNKSIQENSQIVFSKKISISTINQQMNLPHDDIFDIQNIISISELNNSALVCYIDNRTIFYDYLKDNSIAHCSIFFPLSREKYKMSCLVLTLSGGTDENGKDEVKQQQKTNYFLSNYNFNSKTNSDSNEKSPEEYLEESKNYFMYLNESIFNSKKEQILNKYWSQLNNEEKLNYEVVDKDSIKPDDKLQISDVDKFEAQEEIFYSKNFSVLFLIPLDVEHSIFPMPQVVANSRKPNFESLYKPHKKPKKYMFMFNVIDKLWNFKELNA